MNTALSKMSTGIIDLYSSFESAYATLGANVRKKRPPVNVSTASGTAVKLG